MGQKQGEGISVRVGGMKKTMVLLHMPVLGVERTRKIASLLSGWVNAALFFFL